MSELHSLEFRNTIRSEGRLELSLERVEVPTPQADEVVVRIDATPINPADLLSLLGPADPGTFRVGGNTSRPTAWADIAPAQLTRFASRLDMPMGLGTEGAGLIVGTGPASRHLLGQTVATRSSLGMYAQYRVVKATDCLLLPQGVTARQGASALINPLTALGMLETLRREGHTALVHTAAASNLGQMLNRLCLEDQVPLINIVRTPAQVALLKQQGARHVLDSSSPTFESDLLAVLIDTGATLAFDAIGGGTMAGTLLRGMEKALNARTATFSRYGSPVHKQVYTYGVLDPGPKVLEGNMGMAWGVGGWLMTWFYETLDPARVLQLRERVASGLTSTFASHYTSQISLSDALLPEMIRAYSQRTTGEKFLICPHG